MGVMPTLMKQQGWEHLVGVRVETPVHSSAGVALTLPVQIGDRGFGWRDALLTAPIRLVDDPEMVVRVHPGLSLPLGSVQEGAAFRPLSTGSVDPWLGSDVVAGGKWMGMGSVQVKAPVYEGSDDRLQGLFVRADARTALRVGASVVWAGASFARVGADDQGNGSFQEVAGIAGAMVAAGDTWSVSGMARVPLWIEGGTEDYSFSAGLNLQTVLDFRPDEDTDPHKHP